MAKFVFKLDPVLKHRRRVEDDRQRDLAKHLRRRMILQDQLRWMQNTIMDSKQQLGDGLEGQVDLNRVGHFSRYSGQVTQRAHGIVSELARLEEEVQISRKALLVAVGQRKALDIVRENRYAEWKKDQDRREDARIDELNVQRYAMRLTAGVFE